MIGSQEWCAAKGLPYRKDLDSTLERCPTCKGGGMVNTKPTGSASLAPCTTCDGSGRLDLEELAAMRRCSECNLPITEPGFERVNAQGFICADCLLQAQDREADHKHAHPWPRTNATVGHFYQGEPF